MCYELLVDVLCNWREESHIVMEKVKMFQNTLFKVEAGVEGYGTLVVRQECEF